MIDYFNDMVDARAALAGTGATVSALVEAIETDNRLLVEVYLGLVKDTLEENRKLLDLELKAYA